MYFIENGGKLADHAVSLFPEEVGSYEGAKSAFEKALNSEKLSKNEIDYYTDYMLQYFIGCIESMILQCNCICLRLETQIQ